MSDDTGRTALITIAHGRHAHWRAQRSALARSEVQPDEHILVAMADDELAALATERRNPPTVVQVETHDSGLPLAHARNVGAEAALQNGAQTLIFLDVDCLPDAGLVGGYEAAAASSALAGRLLSGPVTYLAPAPADGYELDRLSAFDDPHSARPAPPRGEVVLGGNHDLFWSLSFAVTAATWRSIGGFHEAYVGYGGEDTDFAWTARRNGIGLAWIGDARAYHQHHVVEDPPVRHLEDIMRNAVLFRDRWGVWPMRGWLDAFVTRGLLDRAPDGDGYRRRSDAEASHRQVSTPPAYTAHSG